jgi:hypothetical protein
MSLSKSLSFGDIADKWDSTAAWPIPFLNGDRDVVPHKNSTLLDKFFCDIVGSLRSPSTLTTSILYLTVLSNFFVGPRFVLTEEVLDPEG